MEEHKIEEGTPRIDSKFSIIIDKEGPFLVCGKPTLKQQFITQNISGASWDYKDGCEIKLESEPTALCRCGHSLDKPFCDGMHYNKEWDCNLTSDNKPLLEAATVYDGPTLTLYDNEKYCALARFCDAYGDIWTLIEQTDDPGIKELTIREAIHCPAGRLKIKDKETGKFIEPNLKPELTLIEDPQRNCSGPLWVKGGIPISDTNGVKYEVRNRVTLCRCGASTNKPFCDTSHVKVKFKDYLPECEKVENTI